MTDCGERISIFGLLYEKERKHKDDLLMWGLLAEHQQDRDLPSQESGAHIGEQKSQILKFEEFVTERYFREESDEDYTDQFYEDDAEWYEKEEK